MESDSQFNDNAIDDHVDDTIAECLRLDKPKSFFLFAGAGSGKTRLLVTALERICNEQGNELKVKGKKIAVITYTNAACNEIQRRLNFDPLVDISTIHSFVWELIQGYNKDIRHWVEASLKQDLIDLEAAQLKGRAGKAQQDRAKSIVDKTKKLSELNQIKRFTYNPNGDNKGTASLSHSDVLQIGSNFLISKPIMQSILVNRYPLLLIDESQDTNKDLMQAVFHVQKERSKTFAVGLLGDTMQRIYSDGLISLGHDLPEDWLKPAKLMNHRCPKRVVTLINKIRAEVDGQEQRPRTDKSDGVVRFFIVNNAVGNKQTVEQTAFGLMAEISEDDEWEKYR